MKRLNGLGCSPKGQYALGALYMRKKFEDDFRSANIIFWKARYTRGDWKGCSPTEGYSTEELRKEFEKGDRDYYKAHIQDNWTDLQKEALKAIQQYFKKNKDKIYLESWYGSRGSKAISVPYGNPLVLSGRSVRIIEYDTKYEYGKDVHCITDKDCCVVYCTMGDIPDDDCRAIIRWAGRQTS